MPDAIDVAKYQRVINWPIVGPLLRCASIKSSEDVVEIDSQWVANWTRSADVGLRWRLVNHLPGLSPIGAQLDQVERALEAAGQTDGLHAGEGIALDVEPDPPRIPSLDPGFVLDLAAQAADRFGRPCTVAYEGFFQPSWRQLVDAGHVWWLPWPHPQLGVDANGRRWFGDDVVALVDAWQYGQGTVPGIDVVVDLDRIVHDEAFDRACGIRPPAPTRKGQTMFVWYGPGIVVEVIAGAARPVSASEFYGALDAVAVRSDGSIQGGQPRGPDGTPAPWQIVATQGADADVASLPAYVAPNGGGQGVTRWLTTPAP